MNKLFLTRIISIFSILIATSAHALEQEPTKINIRTLGVTPYGIKQGNNPSGIYFDIANLVAEKAGYESTNYVYPYARIVNELKTGQTDMTIMFKYEMLKEHVIYVAPLPTLKIAVVGQKDISFTSIADLKGKTLTHLRGANFSDAITKDSEILKIMTTDIAQSVRMVLMKRADATIGPLLPIYAAAERVYKDGIENTLGSPLLIGERTPWLQISKKSVHRLSLGKLRSAFHSMEQKGIFKAIQEKYTPAAIKD
ncbi:MAG: transporter substrate-binding domain-containing protein [Sneathiella sp.]